MSWFGHTLLPTVEAVCCPLDGLPQRPATTGELGAWLRAEGYTAEAKYVESCPDLQSILDWIPGLNGKPQDAEDVSEDWDV